MTHPRFPALFLCIALLSSSLSADPLNSAVQEEIIALVGGTLIDGTGSAPIPDAAVVIKGDTILCARPRSEIEIPTRATVINVSGHTILPGFINAAVSGQPSERDLRTWVRQGVTTIRLLGTDPQWFANLDPRIFRSPRFPRLVSLGPVLTVRNGYPIDPFPDPSAGVVVRSPEHAERVVSRQLADEIHSLSISLESGVVFGSRLPVLSNESSAVIVRTARALGAPVIAHVTAGTDLPRVLSAGVVQVASITGTERLSQKRLERLRRDRVIFVSTLGFWEDLDREYGSRARWNLNRFRQIGGRVALGTDCVGYTSTPNPGMPITELKLMKRAGLKSMQIITAATRIAAAACDMYHTLGTLQRNKAADLIVISGNPLHDIGALSRVKLVMHNGVVVRDEL